MERDKGNNNKDVFTSSLVKRGQLDATTTTTTTTTTTITTLNTNANMNANANATTNYKDGMAKVAVR